MASRSDRIVALLSVINSDSVDALVADLAAYLADCAEPDSAARLQKKLKEFFDTKAAAPKKSESTEKPELSCEYIQRNYNDPDVKALMGEQPWLYNIICSCCGGSYTRGPHHSPECKNFEIAYQSDMVVSCSCHAGRGQKGPHHSIFCEMKTD